MDDDSRTTLVLGGTGTTGRRVATRLRELGRPVRIGSRAGRPPFDWEDRTTWESVLAGAHAVYIAYAPDLAVEGAGDTVADLTGAAVRAGARRVVLLSGRGEPGAQAAELLVQDAAAAGGAECTVVRASWFTQNFSEGYLRDGVLAGELVLPVGGIREPFVDADDIADVAVAALTDGGHGGDLVRVHEVTGPEALTFDEVVDHIAAATGRPLRLRKVSLADHARMLLGYGVPADTVELLTFLFGEVLDGRNTAVEDGIPAVLGRPARSLPDVVRAAAAAGAWTAEARTEAS